MVVYSTLLSLALGLSAPWWLVRMALSGRYRQGFAGRLGVVPAELRSTLAARGSQHPLIWLHAVSVGEVFVAERLIAGLRKALPNSVFVVSTTTATGQAMAKQRLTGVSVFFFPLDFAFAIRSYLRLLQPAMVILIESELWPRVLTECELQGVPVAVVNARISDRSYPRYMRLRHLWRPLLAKVNLFLAQGEETAARLRGIGVPAASIAVPGNLKYDAAETPETPLVSRLRVIARGRKLLIAGSTLAGEEALLLDAWPAVLRTHPEAMLLLAPRHPQRFHVVEQMLRTRTLKFTKASSAIFAQAGLEDQAIVLLDTLGDLASVYRLASGVFIGGSLAAKGGHNPLEAARFAVPIVMGPSYENFREIVEAMRAAKAIRIATADELASALISSLAGDVAMGERGRECFEAQSGATQKTVDALLPLIRERTR